MIKGNTKIIFLGDTFEAEDAEFIILTLLKLEASFIAKESSCTDKSLRTSE